MFERKMAEALLRMQYDLSAALAATGDLTDALHLTLDAALQVKGVDCGAAYLPDPPTRSLDLAVQRGLSPRFVAQVSHYDASSRRAQAAYAGTPLYTHEMEAGRSDDLRVREGLRVLMAVPVLHQGRLLCVLYAASRTLDDFSPAIRSALEALARQVGSALARIQAETALLQGGAQYRELFEKAEATLKALVASEERFRAVFEHAADALLVVAIGGEILAVNRAACAQVGYQQAELLGMKLRQVLTPEAVGRLAEWDATLRQAGQAMGRTDVLRRDGSALPVETHAKVIPYGEAPAVLIIARDLTERLRMEAALRRNEAELAIAVEIAHQGYWEYDVAADTFTFNDHFYAIFGTDADRVGGYTMSPAEYARRFVHQDDRWMVQAEIEKALATSLSDYSGQVEHRIIYASGEVGHILVRYSAIKDAQGRTVRTVGANQDITERKLAELQRAAAAVQLAEREATLRSVIAQSLDGIALADGAGALIEWNPAQEQITGLARGEVLGRPLWEVQYQLAPVGWRAQHQSDVVKTMLAGFFETQQAPWLGRMTTTELQRPDGERRFVQSVTFPVRGAQRALLAAICRDVTDLRREQEALVQRQKLESIGALAGGMAHDFNNILQAALGQAALALAGLEPDHPAARHVEKIVPSIERAADLTRQLLAYAGLGSYFVRHEDMVQIIRDSASLARAALPQNADMALDLRADLPAIQADRNQVQQVLMNLVLNAGEAIEGRQGAVTIAAGRQTVGQGEEASYVAGAAPAPGDYVYLQVSDTGTGMDAGTLARACEPFFSTRFTGRGLGLPAVLGIVRSHKGGLALRSQPGRGTAVTVLWPVATTSTVDLPGPAAGAGAGEPAPRPERRRGRTAVLVVDDDPAVLEALADILDLSRIPVLTAANGQEAIAVFSRQQAEIGLVILDILMPVMNGGLALREMRKLDPTVPVVLASGYDDHEIERRLAEWQISERPDAFIQKPIGAGAVQEMARQFLSRELPL
jgi:PAS domain S-box-containing protein